MPDAEATAVEAGPAHIMNLKVIDAWDVQSEGSSWDEARCSAKVTLNTGLDRVLDYRLVPRHGSYFIVTQLR